MKLVGVSMIRNEEDIVEAFLRHNLGTLDAMIVVDHGSADRTPAILQAMCAERLPIVVLRSDAVGYLQAEITTSAARDAFARLGADAVFPLDADEFLSVPSRPALESALAGLPPGHHAWIAWPSHAPAQLGNGGDIVAELRSMRRSAPAMRPPPTLAYKVALTRAFASDPLATITMGNHDVILGRHQATSPRMPHLLLPRDVVEVCHAPLRSRPQAIVKLTVKRLARLAAGRDYGPVSGARDAFEALADASGADAVETLLDRYCEREFGLGHDDASASGRATMPIRDDLVLRYTPRAAADPLPLVASAVERLTRRLAEVRGERPT